MSSHRTRRIDPDTAEQLLRGVPGGAPRSLAELLAAAGAPACSGELAGERAALAAFREARLAPATEPRRRSMIQTARATLLTVKVAAATIGFTVMGGVALAAGTGALPTPLEDKTPGTHPTQAHSSERGAEGAGGPKSPEPAPSGKDKKDNEAKGAPSPSMVGLCRAYDNHPADKRGKALESQAFIALINAAGGRDNVVGYCKVVLAAKDGETPKTHPTAKPNPKHAGTPAGPGDKPARSATPTPRFTTY